jgi:hypothetical protein
MSALWWNALARPWIFFGASVTALYGAIAIAVFLAILIGPTFSGYFLEAPVPPGGRSSPPMASLDAGVVVALFAFLVISFGTLWTLKVWLSKA